MNEQENIIDVIKMLIANRFKVIIITFIFSISSIVWSLTLPNIFTSESTLMPAEEVKGFSGGYSSIASLAGVDLNEVNYFNKSNFAKQYIISRKFISSFVKKHNILVPLMAGKGINSNGELIIDSELYDVKNKIWVREGFDTKIPTDEEIYKKWIEEIFTIDTDKESGFIFMSVSFFSAEIANEWAKLILEDINEIVRTRDVDIADKSIEFYKEEYNRNDLYDLRSSITSLMEKEIERKVLAKSKKEYALIIVDPPSLPFKKSYPSRAIIVILFTMFGFIISTVYIMAYNLFFKDT